MPHVLDILDKRDAEITNELLELTASLIAIKKRMEELQTEKEQIQTVVELMEEKKPAKVVSLPTPHSKLKVSDPVAEKLRLILRYMAKSSKPITSEQIATGTGIPNTSRLTQYLKMLQDGNRVKKVGAKERPTCEICIGAGYKR